MGYSKQTPPGRRALVSGGKGLARNPRKHATDVTSSLMSIGRSGVAFGAIA